MKKLCLLLAVIITATFGCSEEKKISTKPASTTPKSEKSVAVKPKIKTVDELFAALEEEAKKNNEEYPLIFFRESEATQFNKKKEDSNYTFKAITIIENGVNHKGLTSRFYDQYNICNFSSNGLKTNWFIVAKHELNKNYNSIKYVNIPDMLVNKKTDTFKNFFKEFYLAEKYEQIEGKKCYKLTATTDKNNPMNMNVEYNFWIDCERLLPLKYKFPFYMDDQLYIDEQLLSYKKNKKGTYKILGFTEICTPIDEDKPSSITKTVYKKIVYGVPFDEKMLECPKDKNDYKKLQDYFNGLLKKYYDNKYQIDIK